VEEAETDRENEGRYDDGVEEEKGRPMPNARKASPGSPS